MLGVKRDKAKQFYHVEKLSSDVYIFFLAKDVCHRLREPLFNFAGFIMVGSDEHSYQSDSSILTLSWPPG